MVNFLPLGDTTAGVTVDPLTGKHGTINVTSGGPSFGFSQFGGQSYNTNSGTNFITAPAGVLTYPLTITARAKATALPANNVEQVIAALVDPTSLNEFWLSIYNNGGVIQVRMVTQSGGSNSINSVVFSDTNYHNYAAVFPTSTSMLLYIDGTLRASATPAAVTPTGITLLSVGGFNYNTSSYYGQWNGLIEGVRIFKRALSSGEILTIAADPWAGLLVANANLTAVTSVNATVNLSGVSATAAAGTFGIVGDASINLFGVSGTAAAGTLSVTASSTFALNGVSGTAAIGSLGTGLSPTTNLSGISAAAAAGSLGIQIDSTVSLVSVSATAHAGNLGGGMDYLNVPMITIMNDNPIPAAANMNDTPVPNEGDMPTQVALETVINTTPIPMAGTLYSDPVANEGSVP